jgi:hypothetical protein
VARFKRVNWEKRFERTVKDGARPLLILWLFGLVALIYDVKDMEVEKYIANLVSAKITAESFDLYAERRWPS